MHGDTTSEESSSSRRCKHARMESRERLHADTTLTTYSVIRSLIRLPIIMLRVIRPSRRFHLSSFMHKDLTSLSCTLKPS